MKHEQERKPKGLFCASENGRARVTSRAIWFLMPFPYLFLQAKEMFATEMFAFVFL